MQYLQSQWKEVPLYFFPALFISKLKISRPFICESKGWQHHHHNEVTTDSVTSFNVCPRSISPGSPQNSSLNDSFLLSNPVKVHIFLLAVFLVSFVTLTHKELFWRVRSVALKMYVPCFRFVFFFLLLGFWLRILGIGKNTMWSC